MSFLTNPLKETQNNVHYRVKYPERCVIEENLLADNQYRTQNVTVACIRIESVLKYFVCFI